MLSSGWRAVLRRDQIHLVPSFHSPWMLSLQQYSGYPASTNIDCPLRHVYSMSITHNPSFLEEDIISYVRPISYLPSKSMAHTLCMAIRTSLYIALARSFSCFMFCKAKLSSTSLSLLAREIFFLIHFAASFSCPALTSCPTHPSRLGQILCLLVASAL